MEVTTVSFDQSLGTQHGSNKLILQFKIKFLKTCCFQQIFIFALCLAVVAATEPVYSTTEAVRQINRFFMFNSLIIKSHLQAPLSYDFAWKIKDEPSYNEFAQQETGDDKGYITGSYRVLLPDGRTQIVTYNANSYTGFVADVKYEGNIKNRK